MKSDYIWMDGELIPFEEATVHFLSPSIHYGFGAFEGIRCYATPGGPGIFRLPEHLQRFLNSIKIIGIRDYTYSIEDLREAVHTTIQANNLSGCYIRPAVYVEGPLALSWINMKPKQGLQYGNGVHI